MSTGFEYEMDVADSFESSSSFLDVEGKFHVIIEEPKVGVGPKGNAYEGVTLHMSVLEGPEAKKTFNHCVGFPQETDKDGGVFRRSVMSRLLLVTNVIDPTQKGQKAKVDFAKLTGQQLIVEMKREKDKSDKERLNVANGGMAVWHVDDPAVASVPKSADALKLIPANMRHDAAWFEAIKPKPKTATGQSSSGSASSAPSRVNINEL